MPKKIASGDDELIIVIYPDGMWVILHDDWWDNVNAKKRIYIPKKTWARYFPLHGRHVRFQKRTMTIIKHRAAKHYDALQ